MKKYEEKKLFVGGTFDKRIFKGYEGNPVFSDDIDTYTLDEVLELGFVGDEFREWACEKYDIEDIDALTVEDISKAIIDYTYTDEIAGLLHFDNESDAEKYKNEKLEELKDLESEYEYSHQKQDQYGYFRDVYKMIEV